MLGAKITGAMKGGADGWRKVLKVTTFLFSFIYFYVGKQRKRVNMNNKESDR